MTKVLAVTVAVLIALLTPSGAFADQAADREAIHELMWRYARALDTLNADAYVALYTEDGQFSAGPMVVKGRAALREMMVGLRNGRTGPPSPAMYHMTTDSWTELIDDTHARHHTYYLTAFAPAAQGEAPRVAAVGRGVDELVKVGGSWLIQSRNVAPQD